MMQMQVIKTFKGAGHDVAQSASLIQISASLLIPEQTKRAINSFLSRGAEDLGMMQMQVEQPAANAYNSATGGLIEMLEKLVEKFSDEQTELEKQETEAPGLRVTHPGPEKLH